MTSIRIVPPWHNHGPKLHYDPVYNGTNEPTNTTFWDKGVTIRNYPNQSNKVYLYHSDLKHLLTPDRIITVSLDELAYAQRNPLTPKYHHTDLSYPIFLRYNTKRQYKRHSHTRVKYIVMDGHTRVNKAILQHYTTIQAYLFTYQELDQLITHEFRTING